MAVSKNGIRKPDLLLRQGDTRLQAKPDSVYETLRVSGRGPEVQAIERAIMQDKKKQAEKEMHPRQPSKRERDNYRRRKKQEAKAKGQFDVTDLMTNKQVDEAIIKEEREAQARANEPQISQGYDRPEINTNRLADQYSTVSNFYTSLGSPNVMPMTYWQARANPQRAQAGLHYGLNNPGMAVMQTTAGTILGGPALKAAGKAINAAGRVMMPSELAKGIATYSRFAPYADKLATAGKWGDALVGSYFAGNGLTNIGQGLYNVEPSQVAQGGLDLMMATPYGQALRGSKSLMPAVQLAPSPTPTNFLGKVDNFISSPKASATGTALAFGGLTAAANNTPRYKPRLDENGEYIYKDGKIELELDENGQPIKVYPGLFQGMSWNNFEDYLIPAIMAIEGSRMGYNWYGNRKPPRKYTVGTGENATTKYTRDLPERPTGERPTYQEALELPSEMTPEVPVAPTPEQFGVRPRQVVPEFNEPILPDPRNALRVSNVENPRDVLKRRTAGSTPTVEDVEEFRRLQEARAAEGAALADDVAAYESQQRRIAEHNQKVAQADAEYNSPEQVRAREQYQQAQDAYNEASSNYQATYDEALRQYNEQQRSAFESSTGAEWDSRNSLWKEALASPEYRAWQESQDKARGVKNWFRNNKWNIGRFGLYGGLWLGPKIYRGWRDYNRAIDPKLYDGLIPGTAISTNPVDTLKITPGIKVDSLRQVVTDSANNYINYPNQAPPLVDDEWDEEENED